MKFLTNELWTDAMRQTWAKPHETAVVSTEKAKASSMVKKKIYGKGEGCMLVSAVLALEIHFTSKINTVDASAEDHRL